MASDGSTLLATLLIAAGLSALTAASVLFAHEHIAELRSHHDISCARGAARAVSALWPGSLDRLDAIAPLATDPAWRIERGSAPAGTSPGSGDSGTGCSLVTRARCGEALREYRRQLVGDAVCDR